MIKKISILTHMAFLTLLIPALAFGAGSSTAISSDYMYKAQDKSTFRVITIAFTADSSDGSIPNLVITKDTSGVQAYEDLIGWYLYKVNIDTTSGVTVTTDSDLWLYAKNGTDILVGKGVDAVDDTDAVLLDIDYQPIESGVTITVTQATTATNSATGTIKLFFTDTPGGSNGILRSIGSGELTEDTLVYTGACYITAITIRTDGSTNGQGILYDYTSASGVTSDKIEDITVVATDYKGGRIWSFPRECVNGIYYDEVSGTTAYTIIEYIPR